MVYTSADQLSILNAQQSLDRLTYSPFLWSRLNGMYGIPDLLPAGATGAPPGGAASAAAGAADAADAAAGAMDFAAAPYG